MEQELREIIEELRLYCGMDENGQLIINKLLAEMFKDKERVLTIYYTYDESDGEVFCCFTSEDQASEEARSRGCVFGEVKLIIKATKAG